MVELHTPIILDPLLRLYDKLDLLRNYVPDYLEVRDEQFQNYFNLKEDKISSKLITPKNLEKISYGITKGLISKLFQRIKDPGINSFHLKRQNEKIKNI
tara:strand:+ start:901 stop:1197 length:297 start_codon:yes stop_codon:yes gene_type:complete